MLFIGAESHAPFRFIQGADGQQRGFDKCGKVRDTGDALNDFNLLYVC